MKTRFHYFTHILVSWLPQSKSEPLNPSASIMPLCLGWIHESMVCLCVCILTTLDNQSFSLNTVNPLRHLIPHFSIASSYAIGNSSGWSEICFRLKRGRICGFQMSSTLALCFRALLAEWLISVAGSILKQQHKWGKENTLYLSNLSWSSEFKRCYHYFLNLSQSFKF